MSIKANALAKFLNIYDVDSIKKCGDYFCFGSAEYLVLRDNEADEMANDYIMDNLWAFNMDFLSPYFSCGLSKKAIEYLKKMQEDLREDMNPLLSDLTRNNWFYLINDAIKEDSMYDGEEHEVTVKEDGDEETFYIYTITIPP
jgi:hypothetical protein